VVFVHGNPDRGSDWLPLMRPVSAFANVVAPDLPGFGGAERRRDQTYTIASYTAHLAGVIDSLSLERVHLVAHDFGGPFALTWAAANPDRVASVTLINTGVFLDYRWHRLARVWRIPLLGEIFQAVSLQPVVAKLIAHDNPGLNAGHGRALARHLRPWGTKRAVLRLYRSTDLSTMRDLVEPLRQADLPCRVIWGTDDAYLPTDQAHRQSEPFPSAEVHLLPGVGHWAWLEQPEQVLDLLIPHLRAHVATGASTVSLTETAGVTR
jgi:pimeloyl-ACP methyl ester carboxylesterase